ncbi:MAG: DUF3829 domain-containing protein [Chitinophagaceae bacterium]
MKNAFFFPILSSVILLATACNLIDNNTSKNNTQYVDANKKDAEAIIQFNNGFVQLDDRNNAYLNGVKTNVTEIVKQMQSPSPYFEISSPIDLPVTYSLNQKDPNKIPDVLGSADHSFFKTNLAALSNYYDKIKTTYSALQDYMEAEDYKDDDNKKGQALVMVLDSVVTKYYTVSDAIVKKLDAITEDAERVVLKDHPLKDFIFAMKDDRAALQQLNTLIDSAANNYTTYQTTIKAAYDRLETQYSQHSVMKLPGNGNYGNNKAYGLDMFYRYLNQYLTALKRYMRNAAASGKISESDLNDLKSYDDVLRTNYNTFVD